jgi:CheY-like chemotaxis protein
MSIRILVVHEYSVIQKIAQNYIMTEYTDAIVDSYSSTLAALEELKKVKYDIILCAMEMYGMDGLSFSDAILQTINKDTHFAIMTSNYDKKNIIALKKQGVKNILSIPFTQPQLTAMINNIANPRSKRVFERFVLQDTQVIIHTNDQQIIAQLINIGMNGLMCEVSLDKSSVNILLSKKLTLKMPEGFGNITARNIQVSLMRISVTEWTEDYLPKIIRVAYKFVKMSTASKTIIQTAIQTLSSELTLAESQALHKMLGE